MIPEKQKKFLDCFQGACKGRYHLVYLTILGIAGGEPLKNEAIAKFGRDVYLPDQMYPLKEAVNIIHFGMEHGIPAERVGRMVAQSYKRAAPNLFDNLTHDRVVDLILLAYSSETDVGQMLKVVSREPGRVVISRTNSPQPCDYFLGVIKGGFELAGLTAKFSETRCQWCANDPACVYEIRWET